MSERTLPHKHLSYEEIEQLLKPILPTVEKTALLTGGTGGGNTHYHIEAPGGPYILRLYIRYPEAIIREKQIHAKLQFPFMPKLLYTNQSPPYALFKKHPGKRLSEIPWPENLSFTLGKTLAQIHSLTFPWNGLCTHGLCPDDTFSGTNSPYLEETRRLLKEERIAERLGRPLLKQTTEWVERDAEIFPGLSDRSHLVHSDFRPENLLYDPKEGLCVLDWEFAHVGNPLLDLGILLRHENHFPIDTEQLQTGYGKLPPEWEKAAALGDLVNIFQVLNRPKHLPKLFAFLTYVLRKRLDRWHPKPQAH